MVRDLALRLPVGASLERTSAKVQQVEAIVLAMPEVKDRLEKLGATGMPMQQEAFEKYLDEETLAAAQLVKAAGIRIE